METQKATKTNHPSIITKLVRHKSLAVVIFGSLLTLIVFILTVRAIYQPVRRPPVFPTAQEDHPQVQAATASSIPTDKLATNSAASNSSHVYATPQPPKVIPGPGIPILMYHYVGYNPNPADHQRNILSIIPEKLDTQMNYLAQNGYTPITLDTLYGIFAKKLSLPKKPIVLTFDDGYIDFYLNAYPIIKKYGFHAVSFIPTGLIGGPAYMTWDQIKQIRSEGLVDFEAHTISHANLPGLPYDKMLHELRDGKTILESQTGYPANFIAYPYGAASQLVIKVAAQAGFVGGVGTWYGRASGPSLDMPRVRINGGISLSDFAAKVAE